MSEPMPVGLVRADPAAPGLIRRRRPQVVKRLAKAGVG
jgi:hypothetical protein